MYVYFLNGKYILNTPKANYSYGVSHKAFRKIFIKVGIPSRNLNNVLLLGFGSGGIVSILHEEFKISCSVTAIEKDPIILEIGEKYFNIQRFKNLKINISDAFEFVKNCKDKFDLIAFDVYIDNVIPSEFETKDFLLLLKNILSKEGILVYNKDISTPDMKEKLVNLKLSFKEAFNDFDFFNISKNSVFLIYEN